MSYQSWYAAFTYRLDDVDPPHNYDKIAERHQERMCALYAGRMPVDSYGGLTAFMLRDHLKRVDGAEYARLDRIIREGEEPATPTAAQRAAEAGISTSTEFRQRKRAGKTGPRGRPRKQ